MLTNKEKKRVAELHGEIFDLEHSGEGGFCPKLIDLYREMQKLYKKQQIPQG